ncbi:MAG TPA: hypothetical protein VFM18_18485 [Methanosarcina sp.]|nr:hypothetical protein [Methanosarcina sp.]
MTTKLFPTVEIVALANKAFKHNRGMIRQSSYAAGKRQKCNRQLVQEYIRGDHSTLGELTEADLECAAESISYINQVITLCVLKKINLSEFLQELSVLIAKEQVKQHDIGLLSWAPKMVHDYVVKEHAMEFSSTFEHGSKHLGGRGSKVKVKFTLMEKRFVKKLNCWAITGHTEDRNLVFFWTRDPDKIHTQVEITARIKDTVIDRHRNDAKVSHLHYVKILKEKEKDNENT